MKMSMLRECTSRRRGGVLVLGALLMVFLVGMVAFAIDIGYIATVTTDLQAAADATALATVSEMNKLKVERASQISSGNASAMNYTAIENAAIAEALRYAQLNHPNHSNVLDVNDIEFGTWNYGTDSFVPLNPSDTSATFENAWAVQVTFKRSEATGDPVNLFFAPIFGIATGDVVVSAAAATGIGTRFLLDEDMISSSVQNGVGDHPIQDLADSMGVDAELGLLADNDGDMFIDIPPGTVLRLPTGQNGDEGLMDVEANPGAFPFTADSDPSLVDFLSLKVDNRDWTDGRDGTIPDVVRMPTGLLDPLLGPGRFPNTYDAAVIQGRYEALVNPDFIHVSPVWVGDVNPFDSAAAPPVSGVNALGTRRGLVAFRIVAVRPGVYLPDLIIEIVDLPPTFGLEELQLGGGLHLVD